MPLTQAMLDEWQVDPACAERILQAHTHALQELVQQRDALAEQLSTMTDVLTQRDQAVADANASRDALRSLQAEQQRLNRQNHMRETLLSSGANPQAINLLLLAMPQTEDAFDGDHLRTPEAQIASIRQQYPAFFSEPIYLPTDPVSPPISVTAPITREDVRRMSQTEINQNWSTIRSLLEKGSN